ncbi:MAG TPA: hypothetical protein VGB43_07000 [Flavobacterium sp.]|jgi:hypothetical protein
MIEVSTDKARLDIPFIQNFLKDIYWAAGRTIEEVKTQLTIRFVLEFFSTDSRLDLQELLQITSYLHT